MKKIIVAVMIAAGIMSAVPAFCVTEIDRIVAVVGQRAITLSELQTEMVPGMTELNQRLRGDELTTATEQLKKSTLNNLIDKYVQLQEAKLEGIEVSDDDLNVAIKDLMDKNSMNEKAFAAALAGEGYSVDDYKSSIKEQIMVMRLVSRAVRSKVSLTEDEIQKYYKENASSFSNPETVRIASISFPADASGKDAAKLKAEAAKKEIADGKSFEDMAVKCTGNPGAAQSCVLGDFSKGELSPAIEARAFSMKTGEVSDPIENDKGYQLIKVTDRSTSGSRSLEDVREQVVEALTRKKSEGIFAKWIQELRDRCYVEIRDTSF